jgi:hypothetical protein
MNGKINDDFKAFWRGKTDRVLTLIQEKLTNE